MTEVRGVELLKEHLERAKEHLSSTNETIKKYTGREPGAQSFKPNSRIIDSESAGRRIFSAALKRGVVSTADDAPMSKSSRRSEDIASKVVGVAYSRLETRRRERDIYDRLGPLRSAGDRSNGDRERERPWSRDWAGRGRSRREEMYPEPEERRLVRRRPITLSSSITRPMDDDFGDYDEPKPEPPPMPRKTPSTASVVRIPEQRSREDAIKEMKSSLAKDDKERNRRIFSGLLLGTLRNFNSQSVRSEEVAKRRKHVEARIEEREQEAKEDLRRERADLFRARRENQRMVRRIEQKIRSVDAFEMWKKEFVKQKHFIRTRAKPKIFYLPRLLDAVSEKRLQRTSKEIDNEVTERRAKMEEEVALLIEEEPQDPAQLLEETNRGRLTSRLSQPEEDAKEEPAAVEAAKVKDEEVEEPARVEVAVFVGDEEEAQEEEAKKEKMETEAPALEEVPLPSLAVEVALADEDIPLPPSPLPTPSPSAAAAGSGDDQKRKCANDGADISTGGRGEENGRK